MTNDLGTVIVERRIKAAPATVFSFFTDSDRYSRWMGTTATLDARPGGIYEVHTPQGFVARGEYVEVDPPSRIVFTFGWEGRTEIPPGSTRVEVTLQAVEDHTLVRLTHRDLPDVEVALHREGWTRYLDRLVVAGSGGNPGPDEA